MSDLTTRRRWYRRGVSQPATWQDYSAACLLGADVRRAWLAGVMARCFGVDLRKCL